MRFQSITYPEISNGLGCRVVLWVQGCTHHCKNCHNKKTWDFSGGKEFNKTYEDKLIDILKLPYIKGLTISGGEPLDSLEAVYNIIVKIKQMFKDKDIWLYTGYTMKEIQDSNKSKILPYIDFLVDGMYDETLRDTTLTFRGSSNQIIWENKNGIFIKSSLN